MLSDEPRNPLRKVLVANRGEIAVRVIRALHELDVEAVAIYSTADRDSLAAAHLLESYLMGQGEG